MPEPPKFPLPQFQPGNQCIQVNNFIAALEGIMPVQQDMLPGHLTCSPLINTPRC